MTLGTRVTSATTLLTASNTVVRALSLATMPVLTRLLPPDAYGATAIVGTVIALLGVIAIAGMDMSYARAYYASHEPNGVRVEMFAWRYTLIAAIGVGLAGGLLWFVTADLIALPRVLGVFVALGVMLSVVQTMAQVKARLEIRYRLMALAIVLSGVVTAAINIGGAMWWRQDATTLLVSMLVGYLIVVLTLGVPHTKAVRTPSGLSRGERRAILAIGLAGVVTAPMYWILSSLDRWFLAAMEDAASVGIYSVGYNVAILGAMVNTAIAAVWLPEAARLFETDPAAARERLGRMIERLVVALAVVWLAVVAAGGDVLHALAAKEFHSADAVIPFIAAAVFFNGVLQIANAGNLLAHRLHRTVPWWLIGAAVCIGLNLLLIPSFGRVGAAVTQTCAFGLVAIGVWISAQRGLPLAIRYGRLGACLAALVFAAAYMHPPWSSVPMYSLAVKLPAGMALALGAALLIAREDAFAAMSRRFSRVGGTE